MPQIFRIGAYIVYFWSNENDPLEQSMCILQKAELQQTEQKYG